MALNKIELRIEKELIKLAKQARIVTYRELGERLHLPYEHDSLAKYLGPISEESYIRYGIFLSVIVVKGATGMPGEGFYLLAWELMPDKEIPRLDNPERFTRDEIEKVFLWAKKL